jgi:hypothetical protein
MQGGPLAWPPLRPSDPEKGDVRIDEARDRRCGGFQTQDFSEGAAAGAGAPDTQDGAQTSGGAAGGLTDSGEAAFGALTRVPFFVPYLKFI